MAILEQEPHCAGHEKSTLAINNLENETGQLRKEVDEIWKRILAFVTVGSFRWIVGGLVFITCIAVGANWKMLDSIDTNLDTISNKLSYIEGQSAQGQNRTPGTIKQIRL
jgi:hypothetical protein